MDLAHVIILRTLAIALGKSSVVCDLGCGNGELIKRIHNELGCGVVGVDIKPLEPKPDWFIQGNLLEIDLPNSDCFILMPGRVAEYPSYAGKFLDRISKARFILFYSYFQHEYIQQLMFRSGFPMYLLEKLGWYCRVDFSNDHAQAILMETNG